MIDTSGNGHEALMAAKDKLVKLSAANSKLSDVRSNGLDDVPQFSIDIDSEKAAALGISLDEINRTLQIAWGSSYVNDFIDRDRVKRVYLQADSPFRMMPENLSDWHVRNDKGEMVSFSAFSSTSWKNGSPKLERFNGKSSLNILGQPASGISSGEAMDEIEKLVGELGDGYSVSWYGISYEEKQSGSESTKLYLLSLLIVFLSLAALYESWTVPLAVMMVVPLGLLGAVTAAFMFNMPNDVFLQVALLTTVGLAAKNAILIVEFAKHLREQGHDLLEAVSLSAKQRFRPIIMTSLAFTMGVVPLAIATGAGSESQNAIGIAVIGGMVGATFLAIFFVPMFYVITETITARITKKSS